MKSFLLLALVGLPISFALPIYGQEQSAVDQQLQDWAATDAVSAWNKFDIKPDSDHRFNWFEIGVKIEEATEILIPRHGLNETDAKVYKELFENAFMGIARAKQRDAQSLAASFRVPL